MDGNEPMYFYQYKNFFCEKGCKIYANSTSDKMEND